MPKYKTYKYRIYPNKKQKEKMQLTFKMCRYMYNTLLRKKVEIYNEFVRYSKKCEEKEINLEEKVFSKSHKLTRMSEIKKADERYAKVDSLALCAELSHINRAFENFYSGRAKFPKYKKRKDKNTYTTSNVYENLRIDKKNKIRIPKIGYVKAVLHREIPRGSKIKRAIVKEDKTGKYYVSLVLEMEEKEVKEKEGVKVEGLDYKVGEICVTSEGKKPKFSRPYKRALEKLRKIEKRIGRKEKFSKGYWKVIKKIRILHKKVAQKRRDVLHKISNKLTKKYKYIGVEDISMKEIARRLSTGINVYETGYAGFVEMLKYKIKGEVIYVDRWYPSSKLCSKCGNKKKILKLEQRVYRCKKCGLRMDRDKNAAINIKNEAIRILKLRENL